MTQDRLDRFLRGTERVQVRRQAPTECMPPMPLNTSFLEHWEHVTAQHVLHSEGLPAPTVENVAVSGFALSVLAQGFCNDWEHRDSGMGRERLCLRDLTTPYATR